MVAWRCFACHLVYCLPNVIYEIIHTTFKRWNEIKNHAATNKDNSDLKKNAFKDFYDAYAKPQKRQSETSSKNQSQPSTKDVAAKVDAELKKTNEVAQEILSMIEWSQVWHSSQTPRQTRHILCLSLVFFMPNSQAEIILFSFFF